MDLVHQLKNSAEVEGSRGMTGERTTTLPAALELEPPKRGVRLHQLKAYVPSLVIAPNDLGFRLAAAFWVHQPYTPMQRQRRADNRHATGVTHIYGDCIGALMGGIFVPFDDEFDFGKDAFVTS
jgi:hypothetical protein